MITTGQLDRKGETIMQLAMDGWELGNNICVGLALAIFAVFVIGCTMYWIKGR